MGLRQIVVLDQVGHNQLGWFGVIPLSQNYMTSDSLLDFYNKKKIKEKRKKKIAYAVLS